MALSEQEIIRRCMNDFKVKYPGIKYDRYKTEHVRFIDQQRKAYEYLDGKNERSRIYGREKIWGE